MSISLSPRNRLATGVLVVAMLVITAVASVVMWQRTGGNDVAGSGAIPAPASTIAGSPPPLHNTGEDWDAIVRSIFGYQAWLFTHPRPELLENIMLPSYDGFDEHRLGLANLATKGWRYDPQFRPARVAGDGKRSRRRAYRRDRPEMIGPGATARVEAGLSARAPAIPGRGPNPIRHHRLGMPDTRVRVGLRSAAARRPYTGQSPGRTPVTAGRVRFPRCGTRAICGIRGPRERTRSRRCAPSLSPVRGPRSAPDDQIGRDTEQALRDTVVSRPNARSGTSARCTFGSSDIRSRCVSAAT